MRPVLTVRKGSNFPVPGRGWEGLKSAVKEPFSVLSGYGCDFAALSARAVASV